MIAGQGEYLVGRQCLFGPLNRNPNAAWLEANHFSLKKRSNLSGFDPILNIRANPVFDRGTEFRSPVNHRHVRTGAIKIQRRFRSRIFSANNYDILAPKRVGLRVVVRNVRQTFTGHAEAIWKIVVAGSDGNFPGGKLRGDSLLIPSVYGKAVVAALDSLDAMAQPQVERIMLDALAIILERFG